MLLFSTHAVDYRLIIACIFTFVCFGFLFVHQLTGKIENMKIGVLKEGFGLENSEEDVDKVVEEAAELLGSECGAVVEEVSIPMHSDGNCHGVPQIIVLKAEFDNMISPKNKWYLMQENVNEGSAC